MYAAPSDSARAIATATSTIVTRDVPVETVGGAADSTTVRALGDVVGMPFASDSRAVVSVWSSRSRVVSSTFSSGVRSGLASSARIWSSEALIRASSCASRSRWVASTASSRAGARSSICWAIALASFADWSAFGSTDEDLQQHPLVRHLGGDALRELDRIHRALEAEVGDGGLEHGAGRHQLRVRLGDGLGREDAGVAEARVVERLADVQGRPRFERPRQLRGDRDGDDDGEDQRERDQPGRRPERGGITA